MTTPVDVACRLNVRFGVAPNNGRTSLSGAKRSSDGWLLHDGFPPSFNYETAAA